MWQGNVVLGPTDLDEPSPADNHPESWGADPAPAEPLLQVHGQPWSQHLDRSLCKRNPGGQDSANAMPRLLTHRNRDILTSHSYMPLSCGLIYYVTRDNWSRPQLRLTSPYSRPRVRGEPGVLDHSTSE